MLLKVRLFGEMSDSEAEAEKIQNELRISCVQKVRKCSENNEDMSNGDRNQMERSCTGQI